MQIWFYRCLRLSVTVSCGGKRSEHVLSAFYSLFTGMFVTKAFTWEKPNSCSSSSAKSRDGDPARIKEGHCSTEGLLCGTSDWTTMVGDDNAAEGSSSSSSSADFCPICQMPFFILVVQSQRWHIAECLDTPRDTCEECPNGFQCSSTIPNHYKKYKHMLLAQSRANSDVALLSLSQQAETSWKSLHSLPYQINEDVCLPLSSQDSAVSLSASSMYSMSPENSQTNTPPSKRPNGLLLLRSPGPDDLKKKKGWLSNSQGQKSVSSSQESKKELSSTPLLGKGKGQACEAFPPELAEVISYSPLSEFPVQTDNSNPECKKALFNPDTSESRDSMILFSDRFSSEDELFAETIEGNLEDGTPVKELPPSGTQLDLVSSLAAPIDQLAVPVEEAAFRSPQRTVLESLRKTVLNSDNLHFTNQNNNSCSQKQRLDTSVPTSSNSIAIKAEEMPPHKGHGKAGQNSGLRQTDIGVFFGLKPLKEKETESVSLDQNKSLVSTVRGNSWQKRPKRERQKKSKDDSSVDASQSTEAVGTSSSVDVQEEAGRGGSRRWTGRQWNRGGRDSRPCPFYKKIPGTKFVVDAFNYGEIEGITTYFLTHFHSDHYGGLTKNSTVPIYCNSITGNLVKSKLKVADQYVHILPMNTEVTVEGVKVILLDANHCPGAAMLLLLLPDGQTVLHTGDFRADPSMESYPELLHRRIQTLYLDTTYCSPEYTFPKQQDVINFAANSAFESVTLNPRTLVVCGSYSVGKEKVFLALADVLGSKVCLSRDKYNTMCCLESEQIRERITTDWKGAQVHVLPMMQISFNKLQAHLARFSGQYDRLVAFKPTGWTFSQQVESVEDIQPQISGNISIYGIPYSEHSSFLELKRFVQWLRPLKIIPTVNNGSRASRKAMDQCFHEWLTEIKQRC
uniref:DNA cross-link repair 1A protein n=1 Tax=Gouania willdenowi TaxID=441366 RepID=A0A8C5HK59_GOUWI